MHGKSQERWRRQKVTRLPTFGLENEHKPEERPLYFQISVRVLEARQLVWPCRHSANSYVMIVLGRKKYRTIVRRNTKEPSYNECFVYEIYASIQGLRRTCLWLAVMEPRWCAPSRIIGEASLDLGVIWAQSHHQIHKWLQLILPSDTSASPVGYLNVDIAIVTRGEIQIVPSIETKESVENNPLLSSGVEHQRANYLITIYGAFGLPSSAQCRGDRSHGKLPSTFVRVNYCGLVKAKTGVQPRNNNPIYCEQISIEEMLPNVCNAISFEVCSVHGTFNRCIGSVHLKLGWMSHDGENGFLPTFGPSLLHMYGASKFDVTANMSEDGPYHRGALLISLRTIVPISQQSIKNISVEPAPLIKPEKSWHTEVFYICCSLLEVSMLDQKIIGKTSGVALTMTEIKIDNKLDKELSAMTMELKSRKLHYTGPMKIMKSGPVYGYLDFTNQFPVLQLTVRLPDFRFRMHRKNMVKSIIFDMESAVEKIEQQLNNLEYNHPNELIDKLDKVAEAAIAGIKNILSVLENSDSSSNKGDFNNLLQSNWTELDQKQHTFLKNEMAKIQQQLIKRCKPGSMYILESIARISTKMAESKKRLKLYLAEIKGVLKKIKCLIFKNPEGWPDIVIWLLSCGSRVAYARIRAIDVIYSAIPEQSGKECSQIQTILFKPINCLKDGSCYIGNCSCVLGKAELLLWMSLYRHISAFENYLPNGYKLRKRGLEMTLHAEIMMLQCRVFLSKVRLNNYVENNTTCSSLFIRANAMNSVKDSKLTQKLAAPVWNQILKIQRSIFIPRERNMTWPPTVILELIETDLMGNQTIIGRFQTKPVVDDRIGYEHAPAIQWYDLHLGSKICGQILTSVQLLQIPEKVTRTTNYSPVESIYSAVTIDDQISEEEIEPLPPHLIQDPTTYKIDIYWWGLRNVTATRKPCVALEIDDVTIKSDLVRQTMPNCNFPNGRISHIFETPFKNCSSLRIKLCDSETFGRTRLLSTTVAKNPKKYTVNWIAHNQREISLSSASIMSSEFSQVNQYTYVKKSTQSLKQNEDVFIQSKMTSDEECQVKQSIWSKLFRRKRITEEQYVLLPLANKEKKKMSLKKYQRLNDTGSWWSRYYRSTKDDEQGNNSSDIKVYDFELEAQPEFTKFKDWCYSLKFYKEQKTDIFRKDERLLCGFLKAGIAIYKWPPLGDTIAVTTNGVNLKNGYFEDFPYNEPAHFVVRAYLIKGIDIIRKQFIGKSDPYVILSCGEKIVGDSRSLVNSVFPIFGRMFEFQCTLPDSYLLKISLYNHDFIQSDELIGSTTIDLEDRVYSKHRACVGISSEYTMNGGNKWRDCKKPSEILEELCRKNHLSPPVYPKAACVVVNGVEYRDSDRDSSIFSLNERKENICLTLLRQWHTFPVCGYHLVPVHVETRTLFCPDKPGFEKGKIQMWVDIFPMDTEQYIPAPVDITPPKPEEFELRLVVWGVQQLRLDSGANKSYPDIFARVWLGATSQVQSTDLCGDCTNGEGQFNWRMIFNFTYNLLENKIIIEKLEPFIEYQEKVPPYLTIQVLEVDSNSAFDDSILGTLVLSLSDVTTGLKEVRNCSLDTLDHIEKVNLFTTKMMRAWWPLWTIDEENERKVIAGLIDLEMTLLPKKEALLMPVGIGRIPPSPLLVPQRWKLKKKSLKFSLEEKWQCGVKLSITVFLIITFIVFVIYLDVFSVFETTEELSSVLGLRKLLEND